MDEKIFFYSLFINEYLYFSEHESVVQEKAVHIRMDEKKENYNVDGFTVIPLSEQKLEHTKNLVMNAFIEKKLNSKHIKRGTGSFTKARFHPLLNFKRKVC